MSENEVATVAVEKEKRIYVPMAEFIRAHEGANSNAEVSEVTGLTQGSCQARASKYRSKGIKLKEFTRGGGARLDVEAANALLELCRAEAEAEAEVAE